MKKFFGILLLVFGLIIVNIGTGGIAYTNGKMETVDGVVQQELGEQYNRNHDKDIAVGFAFIAFGLIFFVIGIVLTATKTKKQKIKEIELDLLKSNKVIMESSSVTLPTSHEIKT